MKNTDDFCFEGKPSHATAKLRLFAVSINEWDTKEDTGKSINNALYVLRYAKRSSRPKQCRTVKKSSPYVALDVIELHLYEGISQSVTYLLSQSVENSVK